MKSEYSVSLVGGACQSCRIIWECEQRKQIRSQQNSLSHCLAGGELGAGGMWPSVLHMLSVSTHSHSSVKPRKQTVTALQSCLEKAFTFSLGLCSFCKPGLSWDQPPGWAFSLPHFSSVQFSFEFGASGPNPIIFYSHKGLPQPGIMTPTGDVISTENPFHPFPADGILPPAVIQPSAGVEETVRMWNDAWIAHTATSSSGGSLGAEAHS